MAGLGLPSLTRSVAAQWGHICTMKMDDTCSLGLLGEMDEADCGNQGFGGQSPTQSLFCWNRTGITLHLPQVCGRLQPAGSVRNVLFKGLLNKSLRRRCHWEWPFAIYDPQRPSHAAHGHQVQTSASTCWFFSPHFPFSSGSFSGWGPCA